MRDVYRPAKVAMSGDYVLQPIWLKKIYCVKLAECEEIKMPKTRESCFLELLTPYITEVQKRYIFVDNIEKEIDSWDWTQPPDGLENRLAKTHNTAIQKIEDEAVMGLRLLQQEMLTTLRKKYEAVKNELKTQEEDEITDAKIKVLQAVSMAADAVGKTLQEQREGAQRQNTNRTRTYYINGATHTCTGTDTYMSCFGPNGTVFCTINGSFVNCN